MREIRFRAWDKTNKTFHTWGALKHLPFWEYIDNPNYELVQFTGLHDKNGKEIYEGDIVKIGRPIRHIAHYQGEVRWWESGFWIFDNENVWVDAWADWSGEDNQKYREVIGNIYENPELLK